MSSNTIIDRDSFEEWKVFHHTDNVEIELPVKFIANNVCVPVRDS